MIYYQTKRKHLIKENLYTINISVVILNELFKYSTINYFCFSLPSKEGNNH